MFTVEIPNNKNVSILKSLIREKNPSSLGNVDVKDIDLWKAEFPIDDLFTKNLSTDGPKLRSGKLLSDVFPPELDIRYIHVTVCVPVRSEYCMHS